MSQDSRVGLKAAILLTSTDQMVAGALIMPILGYIAEAFPHAGPKISMLMTLVTLFMIPSVLISAKLAEYVSKKTLLIIGTAMFALGGCAGGFCQNIDLMLVTRAVMGYGAGMLFAMPQALIAHLFEGKEKVTMLGWSSAAGSLFMVIFSIIAGVLGVLNWRYDFYLLALYFLLIIAQVKYIPNVPPEKKDVTIVPKEGRERLGWRVWVFSAAILVGFMIFMAYVLNVSLFVIKQGIGTSVQAGFATSLMTLLSFVTATFFGVLFAKLKRFLPILSMVAMVAGFCLNYIAHDMAMVYAASAVIGLWSGSFGPYLITRTATTAPKSLTTAAVSIFSLAMFLGQSISTYYLMAISAIMGNNIRNAYLASVVCSVVLLVIVAVFILITQRSEGKYIDAALEQQKAGAI